MDTQSKTYDVFLSYNSRDHVMVDQIAHWLKEQGISCFLDRWYLVPGKPWPVALEDALQRSKSVVILLGPGEMGHWQQREYYLALDLQKNYNISVIPVLLPGADPALGFLSLNTWVDLRNGLHDKHSLNVLSAAIAGQSPVKMVRETLTTLDSICPYRGLLSYREEDAPFFFGRETYITQLFETLNQHSFVAVLGSSGSGKSSVVRAGLVPHLRQNGNRTVWEIITLVPGDRPLRALAEALIPLLTSGISEIDSLTEVNKLAKCFLEGSVNLRDVVERALEKQPGTDHLLIIVDQWEELYTLCQNNKMIVSFIDQLLDASDKANCSVISTCRGDFSGLMLDYRPLVDRIQESQVLISSMNKEELQQAIEKPAEKVGLVIESGLVQRILNDLDNEPGNLPLLSFLLEQLWDHRKGKYLVNEAYDAMHGVEGAITIKAEEVFNSLSPDQQELLPRIFIQLVSVGNESNDTRRRAKISTEDHIEQSIIKLMADERLFVTSRDFENLTVEVAHEALIRNWKRSQYWIDNIRSFLIWRKRLATFVEEWKVNPDSLLRGRTLGEAKDWLSTHSQDLDKDEIKFIEASIEKQVLELNEEQKTRRQLTSRLKMAILGIIGAVLLTIGLSISLIYVYTERVKSNDLLIENDENLIEHFYLPNAGKALESGEYSKAIIWFYYCLIKSNNPKFEKWFSSSLTQIGAWSSEIGQPLIHSDDIVFIAFSPDGETVGTASLDKTARLWNVNNGQPIGKPLIHAAGVVSIEFSPDGKTVGTASLDKTARLWNVNNGQPIGKPLMHAAEVVSIEFSPDGKTVGTASLDKTARLWNVNNGQPIGKPLMHAAEVVSIEFSPDGKTLLTASTDNSARLWNVTNGQPIGKPLMHAGRVTSIVFGPEGKTVATASMDKTARLWDVENGQRIGKPLMHKDEVVSVLFSPDGKTLATATENLKLHLWGIENGTLIDGESTFYKTLLERLNRVRPLKLFDRLDRSGYSIISMVFSPDSSTLATASAEEGYVRVVNTSSQQLFKVKLSPNKFVRKASFSPDCKTVAMTNGGKVARLWDLKNKLPIEVSTQNGKSKRLPDRFFDGVRSVVFSPDSKTIATANEDFSVRLWDVKKREAIRNRLQHKGKINKVVFSPDSKIVATASEDNTTRLWDSASGQPIGKPLIHQDGVVSVAFSPDGKTVTTTSKDKTACLWNTINGQMIAPSIRHENVVISVLFSSNGRTVATLTEGKVASLWNVNNGQPIGKPLLHDGGVDSVDFSPDGKVVVTVGKDNSVRLWDSTSGLLIGKPLIHEGDVVSVAFSPDAKTIATVSKDQTARLWDAKNGQSIGKPLMHPEPLDLVAFSSNGQTLTTVSTNLTVHRWNTGNGQLIVPPLKPVTDIGLVTFSPDGNTMAAISGKENVRLWDVQSGQPIGLPLWHEHDVHSVVFSPDGKTVATICSNEIARLWDVSKPALNLQERLKLSIEVRTTYKINGPDMFTNLTQKEWLGKLHELNQLGGPCDIAP